MRGWIGIGFGALALAGWFAEPLAAQVPDPSMTVVPAPEQEAPGFDFWGTGEGRNAYNRLSADCDMLVHRDGRNAAWGHWRMPLTLTVDNGPEDGEYGVVLRFSCTDGSNCIHKGMLSNTPERIQAHAIPFDTMQGARDFSVQVAALKSACGIEG